MGWRNQEKHNVDRPMKKERKKTQNKQLEGNKLERCWLQLPTCMYFSFTFSISFHSFYLLQDFCTCSSCTTQIWIDVVKFTEFTQMASHSLAGTTALTDSPEYLLDARC